MPRQTRTRAASSRRRDASTSSDPANAPVPVMLTTADDTTAPPSRADGGDEEDDIYGVSDREMERQRVAKDARAEDLPTPAPANGRTTRSRATAATTTANSTMDAVALRASRRRRDDALDKLGDLTSTNDDGGSEPIVEVGRRAMGDSAMADSSLLGPRGGGIGANLSGLEIHDDEIFGNLDSSFEDRENSVATVQTGRSGTRSADTSAFNVSVFRRQQPPSTTGRRGRRRSSIVSKDDAPIRPSSRGPTTPGLSSTFSLGNFRRRQRQPSILLSSAQKARMGLASGSRAASAASGDENDNAVESGAEEDEDEESFLPEAEGTPVRVSRGRPSAGEGGAIPPEPEHESEPETGADANENEGGRATRSRKRKSDQGHEGEATKRQAVEAADDSLDELSEVEDHSSPPSFIERRHRVVTPEADDAIFAPPASSSSHTGSPTMWPSIRDLGKKHRQAPPRARKVTPALEDDMSDVSEPPSLTHSPNFKANKPTAKARRKESPKLSTADLEALLPRRRRKVARGGYDLDDEDSNVSEQELPPPRAAKKKPSKPLKGTSSKTNQIGGKAAKPTVVKKRSTRRTYGSRSFDKENTAEGESIEVGGGAASEPLDDTAFEADVNEGDESTTTTTGLGRLSNELRAASRKFKEVDQWELDFEEVVEPSSDLPEGR